VQDDEMDPKAWRRHVNKRAMLLETEGSQESLLGMVAPLKYARYSDGTREAMFYYTDENYLEQEVRVDGAVCVEGLPHEVVRVMHSVLHPSTRVTPYSFYTFYSDPETLPYAAMVAGFAGIELDFLRCVQAETVAAYCLQNFAILGMLNRQNTRFGAPSCVPEWVLDHGDKQVLELVRLFAKTRNFAMLQKMERWGVLSELHRSAALKVAVTMVLLEGYAKPFLRSGIANMDDEEFKFVVLNELVRRKVEPRYLDKYACMIGLHVQSEGFRAVFDETVRTAAK